MAYARRDILGAAAVTTLSAGITNSDTSFTIAVTTGWPTGSAGDFFVVLDRGNAGEEKIRCASRSGSTVTVQTSGRGSDGTSAAAHASGVAVEHCLTAVDLDEANYTVSKTVGKVAAIGDILIGDAANSLAKLTKGSSGLPLVAGSSTLSYAALTSTGLASGSVTAAKHASEAWTAYTPALTAFTTNPTLGTASSITGSYLQFGRLVTGVVGIVFGSSGVNAGSGTYYISVPVNAPSGMNSIVGTGIIFDSSAGDLRTAACRFFVAGNGQNITLNFTAVSAPTVTHAVPWTWAANDVIDISFTYESAS